MSSPIVLAEADTLLVPAAREQLVPAAREPRSVVRAREAAGLPQPVAVEVASPARLAEIDGAWQDLLARADTPNVFMNPALILLAARSYPDRRICALLAWQNESDGERLVGVWAFAQCRPPQSAIPVTVLVAPAMPNAYLATPVIDRACLDETLTAMLDRIAGDATLPRIIALGAMTADCATMDALNRVLAARHSLPCIFGRTQRPKLASDLDGKQYLEKALSGGSRKKLRQQRRRLGEKGTLEFRVVGEPAALRTAFEDFLSTEATGWKGRRGTALASDPADAAFARNMIATLAQRGEAAIHVLTLAGHPVSLQVVLRAGAAAYTWKTAYDERLHDYSPGMLLLEDYTAAFLADERIAYVDSCAFNDRGFMATWREREAVADMWIDACPRASLQFTMLCHMQKGYLALRSGAKKIYRCISRRSR